jgi:hypothetical protein
MSLALQEIPMDNTHKHSTTTKDLKSEAKATRTRDEYLKLRRKKASESTNFNFLVWNFVLVLGCHLRELSTANPHLTNQVSRPALNKAVLKVLSSRVRNVKFMLIVIVIVVTGCRLSTSSSILDIQLLPMIYSSPVVS